MRYEFTESELIVDVDECSERTRNPIGWVQGSDDTWTRTHLFRGKFDYTVTVTRRPGRLEIDAPALVLRSERIDNGVRIVHLAPE